MKKITEIYKSWSLPKKIIVVLGIIFLISFAGGYFALYNIFLKPNTSFTEENVELYIPTKSTYTQLFEIITPYLQNAKTFDIVADYKKYKEKVKAGKYILKKGMNNKEIINNLLINNIPINITFHSIQIAEQMASKIQKYIEADSLSILKAIKDIDFIKKNGFNENNFLAMYLPNTYQFFWNTSAEQFRDRMLKEYNKFWNTKNKEKAKEIGLTPDEVITLASIVQGETNKIDEQARVAGVYLNRIKKGMPLQACPTVIYSIKKDENNFDLIIRRLLYKHLKLKNPYNTYVNLGLPPGPIVTPNLKTLNAVLNYKKHDYLYFVADSNNYGYHIFSKTYNEHNKHKKQYTDWLRERKIR